MKKELRTLQFIKSLPQPRHIFVIPDSVEPGALEHLLQEGYVTSEHEQRDEMGILQVAMGLELTPKGDRLLKSDNAWQKLVVRGSMAGASFVAMSVVILYIG